MTEKKKHPGGRPRKFKTVSEMDEAIESYFKACDSRMVAVVVREGKNSHIEQINDPAPYTVTGLSLALGIDRKTLLNYSDRCDEFGEEFLPTIKRARERVHANLEHRMYDGKGYGPGHIFGLKNNYGWKDVQQVEHSGNVDLHFDKRYENV